MDSLSQQKRIRVLQGGTMRDFKPGETTCEHGNNALECKECYNLFHNETSHQEWENEGGANCEH